jgi:asparagine synthase (glutamine-hydrolysing)
MCRLFGNISNRNILPEKFQFEELTILSKKGGPDSTCFFYDTNCQFGFNRLAILDTSDRGSQPVVSPSGRYIMMLNGEIYNYRELSHEYGLTNLRSGADSEVVAQLLDRICFQDLLSKLNGMFAISVWDKEERELYLTRDFAGIKPLFYGVNASGMVFSSQFNQILCHPWFQDWTWSSTGLREYLQFGFMAAPNTVAGDIFQLSPGTWLRYKPGSPEGVVIQCYQRFFDSSEICINETDTSTISGVKNSINDAVTRQLVSDVPLGIFLSGGIDSSLVAAFAAKVRPDVETITIGFDHSDFDESAKAAEYARILGLKNERIILSTDELIRIFDEHQRAQTEPLADYSTLPTYLVSKVASSRFKVMLSGDGGDELFWGYPRFRTFAKSAPYFNIPSSFLRRSAKKILKTSGFDVTGFLNETNIGAANLCFHSYLPPGLLDKIWPHSTISEGTGLLYHFSETDTESVLLYLRRNEFYQHLQKILVKVDRMSMANGLEVRVPLLDKEVIRFASRIRPELLKNHTQMKYILRKILGQYIPKDVIMQTKRGFTPPLKVWSKTVLRDNIKDTLGLLPLLGLPIPGAELLKKYGMDYLNDKHDNLEGIWTLYSLASWKKNLGK